MPRIRFDLLHTVRLECESENGRAEVCQKPDGTRWVKLCIESPACQREFLSILDKNIPVRLESGVLELLLPWHEGMPLRQWLYERMPTLGQRRDACLSLLEQQVDMRGKLPPCLTVLAARPENLTVEHEALFIQPLPELRHWEPGLGEVEAVRAAAAVISEILIPESDMWSRRRLPEELQLLYLRERDYTSWGQLQRDVAAVPDELPCVRGVWCPYVRQIQGWLSHYGTHILRTLAILLLAAALLSLLSAYRQRGSGDKTVWPGMPQIGDQDLRSGEGGE